MLYSFIVFNVLYILYVLICSIQPMAVNVLLSLLLVFYLHKRGFEHSQSVGDFWNNFFKMAQLNTILSKRGLRSSQTKIHRHTYM